MLPSAATFPSVSSQWGYLPGPATATSLGRTLREEKDEAKFPPRTSGTGFSPQSWSWSNTATQIQGSHRLLEGGQGGMRTQPRSAVSYYHMLQQTCGGFFPAYSLQAYNLILLISVGNVMRRWICPLTWYFRQRLIYVYLIIGNAFLNLISFGWFPIYPHIHTQKKRTKRFWLLYFVYITSMVYRGWWGVFFAEYVKAAKTYQTDSLWNWNFLCNPGKNIAQTIAVLATPRSHQ